MIYKQDSLVFQVCVLRYIQVEMAFLATVLYATTGWIMLLILNVFKWFSSQVLHKNTVINLFSSSFQVSRFKDNVYWTLNYWHWTVDLVLINIVQCGSFVLIFSAVITHLYVLRPFAFCTKGRGMLWSILKIIFKTDLSYLFSLVFVSLSIVFVHVLFSCFDLLFFLVLEVMLSSRIYLLPY